MNASMASSAAIVDPFGHLWVAQHGSCHQEADGSRPVAHEAGGSGGAAPRPCLLAGQPVEHVVLKAMPHLVSDQERHDGRAGISAGVDERVGLGGMGAQASFEEFQGRDPGIGSEVQLDVVQAGSGGAGQGDECLADPRSPGAGQESDGPHHGTWQPHWASRVGWACFVSTGPRQFAHSPRGSPAFV